MAPKLEPDDLKTTVYKPGAFFEADGEDSFLVKNGIGASNIAKGASDGQSYRSSDVDKHFKQGFNPLSFSLQGEGDTEKKLKFGPAGDDNNIVYLPYHDNCITSTVIRTNNPSVCYFITDPMSGCNFFIDEWNGDLVCYHANAMRCSTPKAELKANAGAFNQEGVDKMNKMHSEALKAYPGSNNVAELRVAEYYRKAQASVKEKASEADCTDVEFAGGTTIMGFRVDGKWEFWFQTYSRLLYREKPTGLSGLFKSKGKGPPSVAPLKIIDTDRFWHA